MEDLQFIVQRLNAPPFNITVRAVDFEQKTPDELLKVISDVVASLDPPKDQGMEELIHFLCQLLRSEESEQVIEWSKGLLNGEHTIRILHWLLSNFEHLQTRCYLAKFLMPLDVPQEYLHPANSKLAQMAEAYRELQAEFVEVHKEYERFKSSCRSASSLTHDTKQLELEKRQLLDRLELENNQVKGNIKFEQLLKETSKMRQGQDDEIRLGEQRVKQYQRMNSAKQRLAQVRHLCDIVRCSSIDSTLDQILEKLEEGLNNSIHYLDTIYSRRSKLELKLLQVTKIFESSQDARELEEMESELEETLEHKLSELHHQNFHYKQHLEKLQTFQQHVNAATAKLREKQEELKTKELEKVIAESLVNRLRASVTETSKSNEFEQFLAEFRRQTVLYENAKQEIAAMQETNQELMQTEQSLKRQHHDLDASQKLREEKADAVGFRDVHSQLEQTCKDTVALNDLKSQTLDEISKVIQKIVFALERRRKELEPKVHELKKERVQFHDFQENFNKQKVRYEELTNQLKSDNEDLESECARLQEQWMEKERKYHLLCASHEIICASLETSDMHSLLETEVAEQEELVNDLQKQRRHMKEKEKYDAKQKVMFLDLLKLLELKAKTLDGTESFLGDGVTNDDTIPIVSFY
eukprot:CCRYP_001277-RA/>CCRYP_001277-RA protein AED:0.02 eAED:0.02 QI:30/1/1/1/1/1/3/119/640